MKKIVAPSEFINYAKDGDETGIGIGGSLNYWLEVVDFFGEVGESFFFRPVPHSISEIFPPIPGTL